ncbi:MAG TPA: PASTA domain-containing protein [Gaiellaceae bacterium]|nr:PASTA domain-containing protein [Gaiellaceae bacterium]
MAEPPPPRDPRDPADDETVVVPPSQPEPVDETIVRDEWGPETVAQEHVVEDGVVVEEEAPRRRPPTIWPWLLALLLLVVAGLGAYYFLTRDDDESAGTTTAVTTTQARQVSVPDVVGTSSSEATATLRDAGLEANVVAVPSDRPSGQVVAQSPGAGNEVVEGTVVRINIAEARPAPPPATTDDATTSGQTTTQPAATAPPPATTTEAPATAPATVPDVVGQELADAASAFSDEWLKVGVRYVPSNEPQGRVVAQAQPAGTVLKRGDTVQVNVSIGAEPAAAAAVPSIAGRRLDEARQALEQAGFEVLALKFGGEVRNENPVTSQTPAGGASVPGGSLVILYLRA